MSLPVMKIQQRPGMSALLKKEVDPELCRGTGTLLGGESGKRALVLGQPIGKITAGGDTTVTASAAEGNTGTGALTLGDPTHTSAVKAGRYTITFLAEDDGAGDFKVEDPAGVTVGVGKVGTLFGKQVRFTIADGTPDFALGDQFFIDVSVAAGDDGGKLVAWDPTASDGSQKIHGICLKDCEAAEGEDLVGGVLYSRRMSLLYAPAIVWPEGLTAGQKAAALADMEDRLGLIARN